MGLITLTNIEDGQDAVANALNERFGRIVDVINGNIDSQNLKNNAVTREKIAPQSVTSDKLFVDRYIDENGWTVVDYGTSKTYNRQLTVTGPGGGSNNDSSGFVIGGNGTRKSLGNFLPPVGRTSENISVVATWFGNYTGHLVVAAEPRTVAGVGKIYIEGGNIWPSSLAFKGKVNIQAVEIL